MVKVEVRKYVVVTTVVDVPVPRVYVSVELLTYTEVEKPFPGAIGVLKVGLPVLRGTDGAVPRRVVVERNEAAALVLNGAVPIMLLDKLRLDFAVAAIVDETGAVPVDAGTGRTVSVTVPPV